jgi:hypothetical protein
MVKILLMYPSEILLTDLSRPVSSSKTSELCISVLSVLLVCLLSWSDDECLHCSQQE